MVPTKSWLPEGVHRAGASRCVGPFSSGNELPPGRLRRAHYLQQLINA